MFLTSSYHYTGKFVIGISFSTLVYQLLFSLACICLYSQPVISFISHHTHFLWVYKSFLLLERHSELQYVLNFSYRFSRFWPLLFDDDCHCIYSVSNSLMYVILFYKSSCGAAVFCCCSSSIVACCI